jgi:DNA-binding transcriptional LysR family regulator
MGVLMDRLEAMAAFVAVVECRGFTPASRHLGMPVATLSRKVSELETHLRVRLLTRGSRVTLPTEAGQRFFATAQRLLEAVAEVERNILGEAPAPRGELVVSAPPALGRLHIAPLLAEFLQAFPEISVRLMLTERRVDLAEEEVDIALRIGPVSGSGVVALPLAMIRRITCASPAYLAARGVPADPAALAGHDGVTLTDQPASGAWEYRGQYAALRSRLAVSHGAAAVEAASCGAGITRALCFEVAEAVAAGRLVVLLRDFEPPPMPLQLVHPGGRHVPHRRSAFIELMRPRLQARLVFDDPGR